MTREQIFALLPKDDSSAAIRAAIEKHRQKHTECLDRSASLEREQQDGLLELDDAELLQMERNAATLRLAADRIAKQVSLLQPKLAEAETREAREAIVRQAAKVNAFVSDMNARLASEYPALVRRLIQDVLLVEQAAYQAFSEFQEALQREKECGRDVSGIDIVSPNCWASGATWPPGNRPLNMGVFLPQLFQDGKAVSGFWVFNAATRQVTHSAAPVEKPEPTQHRTAAASAPAFDGRVLDGAPLVGYQDGAPQGPRFSGEAPRSDAQGPRY